MDRLRETLGYKATLKRGYAVVRGDGAVVTTREAAAHAAALEIEFADGRLDLANGGGGAGTDDTPRAPSKPASKPAKKTAQKSPKSDPPDQGSLF